MKSRTVKRAARPAAPRGARARALLTVERLNSAYEARCELDFATPFQLLVATILSAQSTDRRVNLTTPQLFSRFPDAHALAKSESGEVEELIRATGFFRAKAASVRGAAQELVARFDGEVPARMEDLVTLPGVGRKTANVVLGVGFGIPGFAVDTHVIRLTNRLGLVRSHDPLVIEDQVCRAVPPAEWTGLSLRLILHGRRVCVAQRPRCPDCILNDFCPSSTVPRRGLPVSAKPGALGSPATSHKDRRA